MIIINCIRQTKSESKLYIVDVLMVLIWAPSLVLRFVTLQFVVKRYTLSNSLRNKEGHHTVRNKACLIAI